MGVNEFTDFAYQVPGLTFNDTGNGEKRYIMRGVQSAGQEQVAVYYDEVPATGVQSSSGDSGSQTPDLALVDLERIEVLKGPQGTTFGANSQTGVVRFIVNKPVLDAVEGNLRVGGESLQDGDPGATASGTFNLPLIDGQLALRTTAYYEKRGGYVDNVRLGNENINSSQTTGGRVMLRYQPTESATIDAMVWLQKRDVDGASGYHPYDTFHVGGDATDPGMKDRVPTVCVLRHRHVPQRRLRRDPASRRSGDLQSHLDAGPAVGDAHDRRLALQARLRLLPRQHLGHHLPERRTAGRDRLLQRAVRAPGPVPGADRPDAGHRAAHGRSAPELDRRRPAVLAGGRVLSRARVGLPQRFAYR